MLRSICMRRLAAYLALLLSGVAAGAAQDTINGSVIVIMKLYDTKVSRRGH